MKRGNEDGNTNAPELKRSTTHLTATHSDILVHKTTSKAPKPTSPFVTPLLTDMYQIGKHNEPAVFDLFFRSNPFKGEFTVFAGVEEVIRHVSNFHFSEEEIDFLRSSMTACEDAFFDWLAGIDCSSVKIYSISEGTIVFPRIPLMRVEGPIAICQLLETTLLTLVNFPSLIATNAARHRLAAGPDKRLLEFGLRRAQGVDGGVCASRYSYMGGMDATSNVMASMLFGIPSKGTQAHSFIQSFIDESDLKLTKLTDKKGETRDFWKEVQSVREELKFTNTNTGELVAFTSYAISFPNDFLALVDTYDTLKSGVPNFIVVAVALHRFGYRPNGVRLDSGDLAYLSIETRKMFRKAGEATNIDYFHKLNIVASNEINEPTLLSLNQQGHEIDTFGIGTNLVTCQAQPALGCVYKLVDTRGHPRIKLSQEVSKVTLPGKKIAYRLYGIQNYPIIDMMMGVDESPPEVGKKILCLHPFDQKKRAYVTPTKVEVLHELVWDCGKVLKDLPSLDTLREYVLHQLATMRPDHIRLLNPTPYKVSVSPFLYNFLHELWLQEVPIPDISVE